MRPHNVIIITSGRFQYGGIEPLDRLIRSVLAKKKTPVLVLGPDGDEFLRSCAEIENCEIVFDPNFAGEDFSSIKAGLHATHGAAFVVPLSQEVPSVEIWDRLEGALFAEMREKSLASYDLIELSPVHLVTTEGLAKLRELPASAKLESADVRRLSL